LLFIFATCNGQKKMVGSTNEKEGQDSDNGLTLVASDSYSGTDVAETLIIKDAKSLKKFYSQLNRTRKPGLPIPDIDFAKEMLIIRCSGATDNGAMPVLYIKDETGEEIVLGIRETGEESSTSAVTTPFSLYSMSLSNKKIIVRD
jgi:hypothetical protein